MLSLQGVSKRYERRGPWVIRHVSLDVPAGGVIRVDGRNGSGKSTLLRVLAGVTRPSRGRADIAGSATYVPERFNASLPFTVRRYLRHMGRVQGLADRQASRAIDDWSARFGLSPFDAAPLQSLSKGTAQKVALVQGFMSAPGLLVLDEAATGLDQAARAALREAVAERRAEGRTTVFVDHDPAAMAGLVTERWLVNGAAVEVGPAPTGLEVEDRVLIELAGPDARVLLASRPEDVLDRLRDGRLRLHVRRVGGERTP